jgi:hypothetical protein
MHQEETPPPITGAGHTRFQETEMGVLLRVAGVAAALVFATSATARAQGKAHEKEHDKARHEEHAVDPRYGHDRQTDGRYERRDDRDSRYDRGRGGPPGLAKKGGIPPGLAKKPGGMPPGQYKKLYSTRQGASVLSDVLGRHGYRVVRQSEAGDSRYVYYRSRDGVTHRATVRQSGDRVHFDGVAANMIREVEARLP